MAHMPCSVCCCYFDAVSLFDFLIKKKIEFSYFLFKYNSSERGGSPARILANETSQRCRFEKWRSRYLRIGTVVVTAVRLLRHFTRWLVFRQFSGIFHFHFVTSQLTPIEKFY
jgi:hypothetical protein